MELDALADQLAAEIDLEPTEATFRAIEISVKRGLTSETRSLSRIGTYKQGTVDVWLLPLDEKPEVGQSIFLIADEYKISEVEDLGYGYHLTIYPVR